MVDFSNLTLTCLSVRKLLTNWSSGRGQPCLVMCLSRHLTRSASKAPCMSIVAIMTSRPIAIAASASCVKEATRSIADLLGRAPLCWGLRMPFDRAVQAICLTTIHSRPFEMQESSAMGRQEQADNLSFFLTLGSIATSASFQDRGKWLSAKQRLKSPWIVCLTWPQHDLRSLTVT